jgi:hypothetical protein
MATRCEGADSGCDNLQFSVLACRQSALNAEYLQAFAGPVLKPADAQIVSSERIPARRAGGGRAMGNATVMAELITQGRCGLGPRLGQVCRSALAQ